MIEALREILEELGYQITAISDSTEALNLFKENCEQFDLVLTDQTMLCMTGSEMGMEIRTQQYWKFKRFMLKKLIILID